MQDVSQTIDLAKWFSRGCLKTFQGCHGFMIFVTLSWCSCSASLMSDHEVLGRLPSSSLLYALQRT